MATGENLFSMQYARNLMRHDGMRLDRERLQFDGALSYSFVEYLRRLKILRAIGWSHARCIPHGGRQMPLTFAAGLDPGRSRPQRQRKLPGPPPTPYSGIPDVTRIEDDRVAVPELSGIGFEGKADLNAEVRSLAA